MKKEEFYEVIGDIDENYISEARSCVNKKTRSVRIKWGSIAVCICLAIIGTVVAIKFTENSNGNWNNNWNNNLNKESCSPVANSTEPSKNEDNQQQPQLGPSKNEGSQQLPQVRPFSYYSFLDFKNSLNNEVDIYSKLSESGAQSETIEKVKVFIGKLRAQNVIVPYLNGEVIELRNEEGYPGISMFASELYGLPWVFYHPKVSNGENFYIKMTYLPDVIDQKENLTASEAIKELSPNSPNINNLGKQHEKIYNCNIKLKNREVMALVYEYKNDNRDSINFVYNDLLVEVRCDTQIWNEQWFAGLSFDGTDKD